MSFEFYFIQKYRLLLVRVSGKAFNRAFSALNRDKTAGRK